jgi:DNA polymerase-3 subunit beta
MKVTIERAELLRGLGSVRSVVEKRSTIPILSNVVLKADEDSLSLRATDLEREACDTVPAKTTKPGAVTVPVHTLYDIARKISGTLICLETDSDNEKLVIASDAARFRLKTLPAEDFPDMAAAEYKHRFQLEPAALRRLLAKTQFAISTEETRYYLNGVYLHEATAMKPGPTGSEPAGMLRAVATDGHRLGWAQMPTPEGAAGMPGVIIPKRTAQELQRLTEGTDEPIAVEVTALKVRFGIGSLTLTSKTIDGTFPDYDRVIPKDNRRLLDVDRAAFYAAADRVATISTEYKPGIRLAIDKNKVTLAVKSPDGDSATEELRADYTAEPFDVGFNVSYLLDIAGQVGADTLQMRLADGGTPVVVPDAADEDVLYVLMPMRT